MLLLFISTLRLNSLQRRVPDEKSLRLSPAGITLLNTTRNSVAGTCVPVIAPDEIRYQQDGFGVVSIRIAAVGTAMGGTVEANHSTMDMATPDFRHWVVIMEISEPMSIALLALGALARLREQSS